MINPFGQKERENTITADALACLLLTGHVVLAARSRVCAQYSRDRRRQSPLNDRRLADTDSEGRYSYDRRTREFDYESDGDGNKKFGSREGDRKDSAGPLSKFPTWVTLSAFLIGIGFGSAFDTVFNFDARDFSSREVIDRAVRIVYVFTRTSSFLMDNNMRGRDLCQAPNPSICITNGYTAMVMDTRMFVSFNPFNVYIGQPEVIHIVFFFRKA